MEWVIQNECDGVRAITITNDYQIRMEWLLRRFRDCALEDLCGARGYEAMLAAYREERAKPDGIKNISLKKRFKFLIRALKFAAARELIRKDQIPTMPKLPNDESFVTEFYTLDEYRRVRHALPTEYHRCCWDVGYWTGMHRKDIYETLRQHLDIHRVIRNAEGKRAGSGMYFFRNTKTKRHQACWLPMDEEFRACVSEYLEEHPEIGEADPIVGAFSKPSQWLRPACKRAGVPFRPYKQLRQSRFKFLEDKGLAFGDLRYVMGHIGMSARTTVTHYLGTTPGAGTLTRIHQQLNGERKPPHRKVGVGSQEKAKKNRGSL